MKFLKVSAAVAAIAAIAPILPPSSGNIAQAQEQCGRASWYALTSMTASGEQMDPGKLTAAHRNLSFGTKVRVINQNNGRSVVVRINDRGPFIKNRVIDVSRAAASELGFVSAGVTSICYQIISS
ncbi:septal ring lytic transglycosylase RlpA family protein [Rhizobium sp. EC-SD404]|uniref:septal ring lytic transglycosylase RlpA family protein n=1 Tax=Rhizobium sp. EC-SD404 TaxID=2038389 RepID=UPI00125C95BC|nr:septal ring lytic transglycosylase RlpA family protein [Rhizobium sp. EC-SD404]VVT31571.1 Endolytic peptidoglycan transglycosylase RlpA [Rhizobium sp. EC-SD404]